MRVLLVMLRKEFRQFFHSSFLPKMCVMFPLLIMLLMPLVANLEVRNVGIVVVDHDHSQLSRRIISDIGASDYLTLFAYVPSYDAALQCVERGDADVILQIPVGFYESLYTSDIKMLDVSANAVNATKGAMGLQYVQNIIAADLQNAVPMAHTQPTGHTSSQEIIKIHTLNFFNPTLNYRYFMIPALMIMLIIMLCGFLPALNLVGEKEIGTIEQINVSPISHLTFTLGKVIPYWIIGFMAMTIGVIIAALVYRLTPAGNLLIVYGGAFLFIIVMTSLAIVLANFSSNMQQVMLIMFFFVIVFILMSGLLTPVSSMPQWAQNITYAIPPRYFVDILRATYLRGTLFADQLQSFGMLSAFAGLLSLIAVVTYRKQN